MKKIVTLFLLSMSAYSIAAAGDLYKSKQSADLTGFDRFDNYFNYSQTSHGLYTLKRDVDSPNKILVTISKKFPQLSTTESKVYYDKLRYLGKVSAEDSVKDEITVELDFTNSNKLTDEQVEQIVFSLDFSDGDIHIRQIEMNSVDSDRAYEIDKDTWGINDLADVRYEFFSTHRE